MATPPRFRCSQALKRAAMLARLSEPNYKLAERAGVDRTVLSLLLHDGAPVHEHDPRVLAVARLLGVADVEAFEPVNPLDRGPR